MKADSASLMDIMLGLLREYAAYIEDESLGQPLLSQLSKFDLETTLFCGTENALYSSSYPFRQPSASVTGSARNNAV